MPCADRPGAHDFGHASSNSCNSLTVPLISNRGSVLFNSNMICYYGHQSFVNLDRASRRTPQFLALRGPLPLVLILFQGFSIQQSRPIQPSITRPAMHKPFSHNLKLCTWCRWSAETGETTHTMEHSVSHSEPGEGWTAEESCT
jgi:hypothetical protein